MADSSPDLRARKSLMLGLVGIFLVQTWMVYTDPVGREAAPLTAEASRGQEVWHRYNCQSCHQLYGFGGFLGPDLTNAARHLTDERLDSVLTDGSEIMPALGPVRTLAIPPARNIRATSFPDAPRLVSSHVGR